MSNSLHELRQAVRRDYLRAEPEYLGECLSLADADSDTNQRISRRARDLVNHLRQGAASQQGLDAFLSEYDLSSEEGVVLMCLAEALLRIPDADTADKLIRDKLSKGDWDEHLGHSTSSLVNASTWGLMLTGKITRLSQPARTNVASFFKNLTAKIGEPVIRLAVREAMGIIGQQFVLGETIEEALQRSEQDRNKRYLYSFDMLGEAALTQSDADKFFASYAHALNSIGDRSERNAISIKLSALHPRYTLAQKQRVLSEIVPRLHQLGEIARKNNLLMTIDAEEADRLELNLDVFEQVLRQLGHVNWTGFGIVVQAYQKRALPVIKWLDALAADCGRQIPVRLVKGAYWDSEIKFSQVSGLDGYPVFTRKAHTDVAYLACARQMLNHSPHLYPQFATHNAHTICAVVEYAGGQGRNYEFQRLHGMGQGLYDQLLDDVPDLRCRVYAPVGGHAELLPYLVRRLLENGANTSFVNRISQAEVPIDVVVADPIEMTRNHNSSPHPGIPLPVNLFGAERKNSRGINFGDPLAVATLEGQVSDFLQQEFVSAPIINGERVVSDPQPVVTPADHQKVVGQASHATPEDAQHAISVARRGFGHWHQTGVTQRAQALERTADLLEKHRPRLIALCAAEGGRTLRNADGEIREAADFCRYYAARAEQLMGTSAPLAGPSGETNTLELTGRGVMVCISPWNFPIAIFMGQIAAALVVGNSVVAKPAEQTTLTACAIVELLHEAGIPVDVLQYLPGDGLVGAALVADDIDGVVFTGSTQTAKSIEATLSSQHQRILPLIAETGGQNAMIVDSSALAEQVIVDVMESAFDSAGQRCSALRVLYLQKDIADRTLKMLAGAMQELNIGDPGRFDTDIGPVIDDEARQALQQHSRFLDQHANLIYKCELPDATRSGTYFAPQAWEIDSINILEREVFGPILHVVKYEARDIDKVIDSINNTGYGLTFGIHSRIEETIEYITERVQAGNIYINRNIIGAVVGVQPFGGEGLSGTGPKAGGPNYLQRFCTERTISDNIVAIGGNTDLLSMND